MSFELSESSLIKIAGWDVVKLARAYLSQISIQTVNDAIKQVSECLDDFQLVRPIVGEVVA